MAPDFPMLIKAALLVGGIIWLAHAVRQLPQDLKSYREAVSPEARYGQWIAWSISLVIALGVLGYIASLVIPIFNL